MKKKIVVFNGVHGAGKSTIVQALAAQKSQFVAYPEVGRLIREEVTYNALESGEAFDREVIKRELAQDSILTTVTHVPLVETWHIGNLGYMQARTPHLIEEYTAILEKQLTVIDPICIFVHIDWDLFRRRATEKIKPDQMDELVRFFSVIKDTTLELYKQLGLAYFTVENQGDLQVSTQLVSEYIDQRIGGYSTTTARK